jgi:HEAT repeat protein
VFSDDGTFSAYDGLPFRQAEIPHQLRLHDVDGDPHTRLTHASAAVRYFCVLALRSTSHAASARVLLRDGDAHVRAAALAVGLEASGELDVLYAALAGTDVEAARGAARVLSLLGLTDSTPALLHALRRAEGKMAAAIVDALAATRDVRGVPWFLSAIKHGVVVAQAVRALGAVAPSNEDTETCLARSTRHPDEAVRRAACFALLRAKTPHARSLLTSRLRDRDVFVRRAAAHALYLLDEDAGG